MKKYTIKWVVGALCALTLTISAFAADVATPVFNAGEVGLSLGTGYVVQQAAAFQQPYTLNISAGAFYFPWKNLGVEANVPFYVNNGASVSEVQAGVLVRLPLADTKPFWSALSPYVGVSGVYNWKDTANSDWAYIAKAGLEVRIHRGWGLFFEGQFRNVNFNLPDGQVSVLGGLHLVL